MGVKRVKDSYRLNSHSFWGDWERPRRVWSEAGRDVISFWICCCLFVSSFSLRSVEVFYGVFLCVFRLFPGMCFWVWQTLVSWRIFSASLRRIVNKSKKTWLSRQQRRQKEVLIDWDREDMFLGDPFRLAFSAQFFWQYTCERVIYKPLTPHNYLIPLAVLCCVRDNNTGRPTLQTARELTLFAIKNT